MGNTLGFNRQKIDDLKNQISELENTNNKLINQICELENKYNHAKKINQKLNKTLEVERKELNEKINVLLIDAITID